MKRTTVSLRDTLAEAAERFRGDQPVPVPLSALVQAALEEYLARRGYAPSTGRRLRISAAPKGSGGRDASAEHDRYLAEATRDE